ncbi:MAG: EamA family transporter [Victivallaceae bacterium]|nr:EamA family transporter [Victivallaceae bacterium]
MLAGLLLVFLAGITWNAEGICVSYCASRKLNFDLVQGWLFLACAAISLVCSLLAGDFQSHPSEVLWHAFISTSLAGTANFFTFVMASRAMAKGPNGLIWAILQSGMIGSFLMGILFFHEDPAVVRITGLLLIIAGIFLMGMGKDGATDRVAKNDWLPAALLSFLLVAVTHCFCTYPSFVPELAGTSSMFRSIGMFFGGFLAFSVFSLPRQVRLREFGSAKIFTIVGILIAEKLVASYLLFFPGMDRLALHHAGGLGFPIGIGVCVGGFSLYSLVFLKERISKTGLAGLCAVLIGIVMISIK